MLKISWKNLWSFIWRFSVLHTVTYAVFGIIFYYAMDYTGFFASGAMSDLMRPTTSPIIQMAVLFQIVRGAVLALAFYPFKKVIDKRWGWFYLFFALFVLTAIGSVITGPGSIEGLIYTKIPISFTGFPEILCQMFVFSVLMYLWDRRNNKKISE